MKALVVLVIAALLSTPALAGTAAVVVLQDGTTRRGEILDRLPNGYLFKSASGESKVIPYEQVRELRLTDDAAAAPAPTPDDDTTDRPSRLHLAAGLGVDLLGVSFDAPGQYYGGMHHASTSLIGVQLVADLEYPLASFVALGLRASVGTTTAATVGPSLTFWVGRYFYLGPDLTLAYVSLSNATTKVDSYDSSGTELDLSGLVLLGGLRLGGRFPISTRFGLTVEARYARSLKSLSTSSGADLLYYMEQGSEHLKPDAWSAWTGTLVVNAHWRF